RASTGAAQARGAPTNSQVASQTSSASSKGSAGPGRIAARSGTATVIGDNVKVTAVSLQSANANGVTAGQTPDPQASAAAASMWADASKAAPQAPSGPV